MKTEDFLRALERSISIDAKRLSGSTVLEELEDWDSMAVLEFQALADEELDVQVDPAAIANCSTVDELCALVADRLDG